MMRQFSVLSSQFSEKMRFSKNYSDYPTKNYLPEEVS